MRNILEALILGAILFAATSHFGAGGQMSDGSKDPDRSLKIGLGVQVDADWISVNGSWTVKGNAGGVSKTHEIRIGAVPNVVHRVKTGYVLIRAIRTATYCAAKHWYSNHGDDAEDYPESK
jgi:hypothetical protein